GRAAAKRVYTFVAANDDLASAARELAVKLDRPRQMQVLRFRIDRSELRLDVGARNVSAERRLARVAPGRDAMIRAGSYPEESAGQNDLFCYLRRHHDAPSPRRQNGYPGP